MAVELLVDNCIDGETDRAIQACNDYLRMGPGRSLSKLLKKYQRKKPTKTHQNAPVTESIDTLKKWSSDYRWPVRASLYDAEREAERNAKRQEVIDKGLALDYERITKLKRLALFLERQIFDQSKTAEEGFENHKLWLPDVKQIGGGEFAERVDIVRFNGSLLEQYRGVLNDLAAETGGRKQKQGHSGTITTVGIPLDEWRQQQAERQRQAAATLDDFADIDE